MKQVFGLSKNVSVLGVASPFADISPEMIYPLVPVLASALSWPHVLAYGFAGRLGKD